MKEIPLTQGTAEWLKWRTHGISASDAAVLMGESPYKTPWRLWAERVGKVVADDLSRNPNVLRGKAYEDTARAAYDSLFGTTLFPTCGEADQCPILRASFDGLDEHGRPGELKVPSDKTFEDVATKGTDSRAYKVYWHQVQHQLYVAGADMGRLFFYSPTMNQALPFEISRDEEYLKRLLEKSLEMWTFIQTGKAPPLDPERDIFQPNEDEQIARWRTLAAELHEIEKRLNAAKAVTDPLEATRKRIEEDLSKMMGDFMQGQYGGVKLTRYFQEGTVDFKKAILSLRPETQEQELEAYRRKGGMRSRMSLYDPIAAQDASPMIIAGSEDYAY